MKKEDYQKHIVNCLSTLGFEQTFSNIDNYKDIKTIKFQHLVVLYLDAVESLDAAHEEGCSDLVIKVLTNTVKQSKKNVMVYVYEQLAYPPLPKNTIIELTKNGEVGYFSDEDPWELAPEREATSLSVPAAERISKILEGNAYSYETRTVTKK